MRLRELITEIKTPEIEIGKHKIKIVGSFRSSNPLLAGNLQASIEFDGKKFSVIRQGGIGIWAFSQRPKFTSQEEKKFDKFMDANIKKARKLTRSDKPLG